MMVNTRPALSTGNLGRDIRQRSGLALQAGKKPELLPNNMPAIAVAYELPINNRIINSQPSMKSIDTGNSMNWHERNSMVSYSAINLRPGATSANSDTRSTTSWPTRLQNKRQYDKPSNRSKTTSFAA